MKRVISIIVCIIIVGSLASCVNKDGPCYIIGSDMIDVLKSYKNGNIDEEEAKKQLEDLIEQANYVLDNKKDDEHKLSQLLLCAEAANMDFSRSIRENEPVSISDINEDIRSIEEKNNQ